VSSHEQSFLGTFQNVQRGNVLIIEDNEDTAEMLMQTLSTVDFGVRNVASRDEGLTALARNLYQFVILDFYMPGMKAETFIEKVRKLSDTTKIILITAASEAPALARGLKVDAYLGKPFSPDKLITLIKGI